MFRNIYDISETLLKKIWVNCLSLNKSSDEIKFSEEQFVLERFMLFPHCWIRVAQTVPFILPLVAIIDISWLVEIFPLILMLPWPRVKSLIAPVWI